MADQHEDAPTRRKAAMVQVEPDAACHQAITTRIALADNSCNVVGPPVCASSCDDVVAHLYLEATVLFPQAAA
ncbi:hypothetical protein DPM13_12565 [Paracoccus mutanolyticus]|uniref:Uncharacterized protein n=1 Tax=Paracoccus mutanolyticus TaxID=1499308 RepID=A0ABN5M6J3_9RHOB|nr:hypothetical protein [Paracoccus mutanolyticus]AWX93633.1 hypothetical protein DPM13_12565 [Paracoccus mutanolyticus]